MTPYHGTPIGGSRQDAARFLVGRNALVPYPRQDDIGIVADVCQRFVLDNGVRITTHRSGPAKTGAAWGGRSVVVTYLNHAHTSGIGRSSAKVSAIAEEIAAGALQRDICAKHGISLATASKINQGKHLHQRLAAGHLGFSHLGVS